MRTKNMERGFYIYGKNAVMEALVGGDGAVKEVFIVSEKGVSTKGTEEIVAVARSASVSVTTIDGKRAKVLVGDARTQGVIAYYTGFTYTSIGTFEASCAGDRRHVVVILDGVEDVHNFGAIVRTAAAVGVSAVFISEFGQAPVNATVFKTSAGNVIKVPIIQFSGVGQLIESLKKMDFWIYGIDMDDTDTKYPAGNIWQQTFDGNTALLLGAEGKGISAKAKERCDFVTPIPMEQSVESLNVSVATAVALYEWKRQTTQKT